MPARDGRAGCKHPIISIHRICRDLYTRADHSGPIEGVQNGRLWVPTHEMGFRADRSMRDIFKILISKIITQNMPDSQYPKIAKVQNGLFPIYVFLGVWRSPRPWIRGLDPFNPRFDRSTCRFWPFDPSDQRFDLESCGFDLGSSMNPVGFIMDPVEITLQIRGSTLQIRASDP